MESEVVEVPPDLLLPLADVSAVAKDSPRLQGIRDAWLLRAISG
jgi:hypothetical protein